MNQEQRQEGYKSYDWSANEKWQSYLQNVYPVPPLARLEKMKRKWYKGNVDKEFDVDFASTGSQSSTSTSGQSSGAQTNTTNGSRAAPPQGAPQFNNFNSLFPGMQPPGPDQRPDMKGPQFMAWLFFFVSYLTGMISPTMAGLAALALGIVRKGGIPQMNAHYLQTIMIDENAQTVGFLMIASTSGSLGLMCWAPIMIHAALTCAWIAHDQSHVGALYCKVINLVKKAGLQKVSDNQTQLWFLRHDLEVYLGVYLTLGIPLGVSSILTTLLYWQIMRMRYLMSPACQEAYVRFDASANTLFAKSWCPNFVENLYGKVRGFFKSQIDSTVNQASSGQASGLGSGLINKVTQSCAIF